MKQTTYSFRNLALGLSLVVLASCAKQPLTSALFKQSGRAHIYLPTQKEERSGILAERVDYQTKVDTIRRNKTSEGQGKTDDPNIKSYDLQEVTVVADRPKVKISTIRNGRINVSFLMTLPKSFMNEHYQIVLSPKLLNGDSVLDMPPMVLQGSKFKAQQDAEYARYEAFEKGIVDPSKYDSVYFDQKRHDLFMTRLQRSYLQSYQQDYDLQMRYDKWRRTMEERQIDYKARVAGAYDSRRASEHLETLRKAYNLDLYGEDSSALRRRFDSLYTAEHREKYIESKARKIELRDVPRSFRTLYKYNLTIDSLRNKSVTEQDSITVAKDTYKHRAIAHNEAKRSHRETFRRHLINLKRIDNPHRIDSIQVGKDFAYLYSEDIPVTEHLQRRLRVVLETRVIATDKSTWWQSRGDTLSFVISGINDLVDRGQIDRLEGEQRAEYQQGLDRLAVRDYRGALDIFNRYPDYNAAVCLVALGYNTQAETFIGYLKPANGKVDYLSAIVQLRLGKKDEAKRLLISAATKEPQMGYRAENDPEFAALFAEDPALLKRVLQASEGEDAPEEV